MHLNYDTSAMKSTRKITQSCISLPTAYIPWTIFVKPIFERNTKKRKASATTHEGVREEMERSFGAHMSRWVKIGRLRNL